MRRTIRLRTSGNSQNIRLLAHQKPSSSLVPGALKGNPQTNMLQVAGRGGKGHSMTNSGLYAWNRKGRW